MERFFNDFHPHHPTSTIFHCYPFTLHHPCPPQKIFYHTPSAFRINEILTTLKQYSEGLRAIVNETNSNYQELNPLQYGRGGWGHYAPYRIFLCCIKTVCSREMNETFRLLISKYLASENVILNHLGLNSLPWQPYC